MIYALLLLYVILLNVNRVQLPVIKLNNTGTANILPYSGLFSKQKFLHKKQNLNFERF